VLLSPGLEAGGLKTSEFDYELPPELIAQQPLPKRDASRMMVVNRGERSLTDHVISDLPEFLRPGDVLVLNDAQVINARLFGYRDDTGGNVEVLLVEPVPGRGDETPDEGTDEQWLAMYRASGSPRQGLTLTLGDGQLRGRISDVVEGGRVLIKLSCAGSVLSLLSDVGHPPLPPYIRRGPNDREQARLDHERYQTIYASHPGAIAAPTAGLHFTPALLDRIRSIGVETVFVTLHVGPGTFKPVTVDTVADHEMEEERFTVADQVWRTIQEARRQGGRIVAVGTTSLRALESMAVRQAIGEARTSLFITPPYRFQVIDCLLTNFHLPRSTLLMLVSALAGGELIQEAYAAAVTRQYRFYSYGDCMFIN